MALVSVLNTTSQLSGKTIAVCENDQTISGAWTFSGNQTFTGNVTIGNAVGDTLTVTSTIVSNLIFTDATYDIGASGATRPRDLFLSRNATIGGTIGVTGAATLSSTLEVVGNATLASATGGAAIVGGGAAASELRLLEPSGSGTNYSGFKSPALAGNVIYTLPTADGSANQVLSTNASGVLSWATASVKPFLVFTQQANVPPTANFATPDTRNSHPVLDFDGTADEEAVFSGVLPTAYAGGGLTVEIWVSFTSATSGSAHFQVAIERMDVSSLDTDADSFAAFNESDAITAPGTSGQLIKTTTTFTDGADMDSLAAGEAFRLKIRRDADGTGGTDDITTDAELLRVVMRET